MCEQNKQTQHVKMSKIGVQQSTFCVIILITIKAKKYDTKKHNIMLFNFVFYLAFLTFFRVSLMSLL